jgi:prenyltransferase beta subunit
MTRFALAALSLLVCLAPARAQSPEERKRTVAYLEALQTKKGGFLPARPDPKSNRLVRPSLRATSAANRALKYFGGKVPDPHACARFVTDCFDVKNGGYADTPGAGKTDVFTTAVGLMAAVELKLPPGKYQAPAAKYLAREAKTFEDIRIAVAGFEALGQPSPRAKEWLEQVNKLWNADGTAGKGDGAARETASVAVTVLRLGVDLKDRKRVLAALEKGQRKDGGYGKEGSSGTDLETTYRVMRAFVMLNARPKDVAGLRKFVARCRNADSGYGVAPGQESTVGATYFAGIILHWLGKEK